MYIITSSHKYNKCSSGIPASDVLDLEIYR